MESTRQKHEESEGEKLPFLSEWVRSKIYLFNDSFNSLSINARRRIAISCGIAAGVTALLFTIMPFYSKQENIPAIEPITLPQDIYEHNEMEQHNEKTLAPLGKMKGEIDGTFEAFYVAVDNEGTLFINHDPGYGADRFLKTNGWEAITSKQFREYEKELRFIPHARKGLTP